MSCKISGLRFSSCSLYLPAYFKQAYSDKEAIQKFDFAGVKIAKDKSEADFLIPTHFQKVKSISAGTYAVCITMADNEGN